MANSDWASVEGLCFGCQAEVDAAEHWRVETRQDSRAVLPEPEECFPESLHAAGMGCAPEAVAGNIVAAWDRSAVDKAGPAYSEWCSHSLGNLR
jgi:hypothetical protein